jgi:hypothetical protein
MRGDFVEGPLGLENYLRLGPKMPETLQKSPKNS